jgi:hypothetical protein
MQKLSGIRSLDDRYKRISDAAHEIGDGERFKTLNEFFSKLAHPTALGASIGASI